MKPADRNQPGTIETRIFLAVMALLVIVAGGVCLRQFRFNPAVVALRPDAHQPVLSVVADQAALLDTTGTGIVPFSPPEHFGPDTLYEKIDGRADLYLAAGFISLNTQRFVLDRTADKWIELFVYDMGAAPNAYSVFSMQRREDARPIELAPAAYGTENAVFMAHGKFYLEMIAMDDSLELQKAMEGLARVFINAHGDTATQPPGADLFPQAGSQPGTLQLISANAFGYARLDQVYTCAYPVDGRLLTAFVSDRQTAEAASALVDAYRNGLLTYGATRVDASFLVDGAAVMRFFDTYEIVFSRGPYLAGVHEAVSLEAAAALARRLAKHLEGLHGK
ncbi:MAG: DUF6599 family protein [Desulfobacterales bacterium]